MELESAKIGEAEQSNFFALDNSGRPVNPNEAIVPIVKKLEDGKWQLIGTGFFLTGNGLVATAGHVLVDSFNEDGTPKADVDIIQFRPDGREFYRRRLVRCSFHVSADVAVGVAQPLNFIENNRPLVNKSVTLSTRELDVGERIFTYAYPNTVHVNGAPPSIYLNPRYYDGAISKYFPSGRDRVLLPNSCYQTSMTLHGGASGGPVFDSNGTVIGINSTGYDGCHDISFISCVRDLLVLNIASDNSQSPTYFQIKNLAERGYVRVEN